MQQDGNQMYAVDENGQPIGIIQEGDENEQEGFEEQET